jgi:hypothetical protein
MKQLPKNMSEIETPNGGAAEADGKRKKGGATQATVEEEEEDKGEDEAAKKKKKALEAGEAEQEPITIHSEEIGKSKRECSITRNNMMNTLSLPLKSP